jgi:hypothetical protein
MHWGMSRGEDLGSLHRARPRRCVCANSTAVSRDQELLDFCQHNNDYCSNGHLAHMGLEQSPEAGRSNESAGLRKVRLLVRTDCRKGQSRLQPAYGKWRQLGEEVVWVRRWMACVHGLGYPYHVPRIIAVDHVKRAPVTLG